MLHLVQADGKYHGDVDSMEAAKAHVAKQKMTGVRVLTTEEWNKVTANPDQRAELCGTLGTTI